MGTKEKTKNNRSNLSKKKLSIKLPKPMIDAFLAALQLRGTVKLSPLGTFRLTGTPNRKMYSNLLGKVIELKSKPIVKFKMSKTLKDNIT